MRSKDSHANVSTLIEMIALLHLGEYTAIRLAETVGINTTTARKWLKLLARPGPRRLIHISGWIGGGNSRGSPQAIWAWGSDMVDAPRPSPLTKEEINHKQRIRWAQKHGRSIATATLTRKRK